MLKLLEAGRMTGLEPATFGITIRCSNQLSYKLQFEKKWAEAQGFEPRVPFQVRQFSRLMQSTALPHLRFSIVKRAHLRLRVQKYSFFWNHQIILIFFKYKFFKTKLMYQRQIRNDNRIPVIGSTRSNRKVGVVFIFLKNFGMFHKQIKVVNTFLLFFLKHIGT
jgi:hypothetical protein